MRSNKILDDLMKDVDADLHFLRRHKANIKAFAKEYHNEQLILKDVSHQRELLWAFINTISFDIKHETYEEDVEYFLTQNNSL